MPLYLNDNEPLYKDFSSSLKMGVFCFAAKRRQLTVRSGQLSVVLTTWSRVCGHDHGWGQVNRSYELTSTTIVHMIVCHRPPLCGYTWLCVLCRRLTLGSCDWSQTQISSVTQRISTILKSLLRFVASLENVNMWSTAKQRGRDCRLHTILWSCGRGPGSSQH